MIEREVDFTHGYRMLCEHCGRSNWLSADRYAGSSEAMTTCSSCEEDFNFGRAVIDLRDPRDPALDDSYLPLFFWYHTSTDPDWPRVSKPLTCDEISYLQRAGWSKEKIERHCLVYENQAFHLGTYEAAIESMLRRMNEQDDQASIFYLYRVRLRQNLTLETGFRNENHNPAAKITSFDLELKNLDGIRYLNAYESMGSISLAVVRGAIESTQRILVPIPTLVEPPDSATVERVHSFRRKVRDICTAHAAKPHSLLDKLRLQSAGQTKGQPLPEPNEAYKVISKMRNFLADQYLSGLSPVVREDFLRSLHSPRPSELDEGDLSWLSKFMGLAALFTRPEDVQKILTDMPWTVIESA